MSKKRLTETEGSVLRRSGRINNLEGINMLDDNSLISIFEYLSNRDKIRIERVCKRWKSLSKHSWSNINSYVIDFPDVYKAMDFYDVFNMKKINNQSKNILSRCGYNLAFLTIGKKCYDPADIARYCKNIIHFNLNNAYNKLIDKSLDIFFKNNSKLESLRLENIGLNGICFESIPNSLKHIIFYNVDIAEKSYFLKLLQRPNLDDVTFINPTKDVLSMFLKSTKENSFNITKFELVAGEFYEKDYQDIFNAFEWFQLINNLKNLKMMNITGVLINESNLISIKNSQLESIKLCDIEISLTIFFDLLTCSDNLNELILSEMKIDDNHAKAISLCSNLKNLSFDSVDVEGLTQVGSNYLGRLTKLEELTLIVTGNVNDDLLISISRYNKLKSLKIMNTIPEYTDVGLTQILTSSINLEKLDLTVAVNITDDSISLVTNLKEFCCTKCPSITNEGLKKLLENSPNLKILKINDCEKITKDLLTVIVNTINVRSKSSILKINITGISNDDVNKISKAHIKYLNIDK